MIIGDGGHASVIKTFFDGDIVAIGDNATRKRVVEEKMREGWWTNDVAIHPTAVINGPVSIGVGTVIMAGVIVQIGAWIGKHVILNTGCVVDHDCIIEDYAHIAPGAHLCGNVHIGEGTLVGVGVGIGPNTKIPSWSIVKAARLDICPCTQ